MSYIALFLLGVIAIRFFLTYPPGIDVPAYQRQSDALTSLGLLIGLVSIMGPFIVMLVDLIFKYFADAGVIFQFEITRFGASVAWTLIGVGLIAFECIQALLRAREQII
jgi:hypothetical protein